MIEEKDPYYTGMMLAHLDQLLKMLTKFAKTLQRHHDGILAYHNFPISTGPLEGTNNKIKTLQKQAYGFRDMEFFKLKFYALHETK